MALLTLPLKFNNMAFMKERISETLLNGCDAPQPQESPISADDMAAMLESPEKLKSLAKSALIEIIRHSSKTPQLVPAIKELLDRVEGKSKERIEASVTVQHNAGDMLMLTDIQDELVKWRKKQPVVIEQLKDVTQ